MSSTSTLLPSGALAIIGLPSLSRIVITGSIDCPSGSGLNASSNPDNAPTIPPPLIWSDDNPTEANT